MSEDQGQALRAARRLLEISGSPSPERDASALMDAVVGDLRPWDPLPQELAERFHQMVARRARGEPVAQITQRRAFWEHEFHVTADVLDPRPDTETLVEAALAVPFTSVLDLGTGSGCIILSLLAARPDARGVAVDLSSKALDVAADNAQAIGVADRVLVQVSDWFEAVEGTFDLIVSNPPYISEEAYASLDKTVRDFEPKLALTPGGDGLAAYRVIVAQAQDYLTPDGVLMVEIGFDQASTVTELFAAAGFHEIQVPKDLNGKDRVISGKKPV